jgi:hypothetical protein
MSDKADVCKYSARVQAALTMLCAGRRRRGSCDLSLYGRHVGAAFPQHADARRAEPAPQRTHAQPVVQMSAASADGEADAGAGADEEQRVLVAPRLEVALGACG